MKFLRVCSSRPFYCNTTTGGVYKLPVFLSITRPDGNLHNIMRLKNHLIINRYNFHVYPSGFVHKIKIFKKKLNLICFLIVIISVLFVLCQPKSARR